MKARWLNELRQLVASPEFKGWFEAFSRALSERDEARERHHELLGQAMLTDFRSELTQKDAIDTLYRSDEHSDAAAAADAEAQQLENESLESVAVFEEQRFKATDTWFKACAAERLAEQLREKLAWLRARPPAAGKDSPAEIARLEAELKRAEKAHAQAAQASERENAEKARLWAEVERRWDRSMELALKNAEEQLKGRKVRAVAERLFKEADARKQRAEDLKRQAEAAARDAEACDARVAALLAESEGRFGCSAGLDFLYFHQRESPKAAWCVALAGDEASYNIEVKALALLSVDGRRGVQFLEPAVDQQPSDEEGDRRFEEYFLKGRKGDPRPLSRPA